MKNNQMLIVICLLGMVLLYAFWGILVKWKAMIDFHKIKQRYKNKKTDNAILYDVVKKLTSNCRETYAVVDYVDVTIGSCIFKLVKGTISLSALSSGNNFSASPSFSSCQIFYACCMNSESLAETKRMTSLFDLIAEDENYGILKIKSMGKIRQNLNLT